MKRIGLLALSATLFMSGTAIASEVTSINYWSRSNGPDSVVKDAMVAAFNEAQSEVEMTVQFMTWGGAYYGKIRSSILSGSPPEVFDVAAYAPPSFYNNVESFSKEELAAIGINVEDYVQEAWDVVKYEGRYYGTVNAILPLGLFYNKDMFEAAGLDPNAPPRTGAEFLEYAQKLTLDTDGDGKIDQWGTMLSNGMITPWEWESILVQGGGSLLNEDLSAAAFNNQVGIDALNLLLDFSRKYNIAPPELADDGAGFAGGRVAMILSGPWMIPGFLDKVNFGTGWSPQFGAVRPAAWSSVDAYFFPKGMRRDQEKWDAITKYASWVAGDGGMEFYATVFVPTQRKTLESPLVTEGPYLAAFADQAANGGIYFPQPHKDMQEMYDVIISNLQGAFAGTLSAEEALKTAEDEINAILDR